jgi:anthranilate synthase component 1
LQLESAENRRSWSGWSFGGANSAAALTAVDGELVWTGEVPAQLPTGGDPLEALRAVVEELQSERLPGLPPLTGGMVGYLGYDIVRRLERLPVLTEDDLHLPELVMLLATDLAAVDHHEGTITLIANAINWDASDERVDEAYDDAVARLDRMTEQLAAPAPSTVAVYRPVEPAFIRRRSPSEHHAAIEEVKEQIRAGEAFQVVVSQRFEAECRADPLDVYRVLRATNPSPYMYLLRLESAPSPTQPSQRFDIVGSSPEALVTVRDGTATTHPIAGTRWRGTTEEEDVLLEKELRSDEKERAEHVMLVDLGRNDLGRVCEPGTVKVHSFFSVERYSHVMHLVSTVTGRLRADCNAFDAVKACFPAGTLSGAPKPRAMEIIEELEPTRRGLYGGIVGYLDFAGDADTAIAIRTALVRDGVAYVQAGGGIVADSDPVAEDTECLNKARAVLNAIAAAGTLRAVG